MTSQADKIPLVGLKAQFESIDDEVRAAVDRVLASQQFILGPEVEGLEAQVAAYCGCEFGIGASSGTDALLVALMALGIGTGDEVIVPSYTFFATAGCVARLGAKPVFADIDPLTFNLDPAAVESLITPRTRAIVPVHLFGQMADMQAIMDIARRHNLRVIEDAAQAIGSEYEGRRAGSIGYCGCLSFFPAKTLGGIGDGGMIVTNDQELAERARVLRSHGSRRKYFNEVVGGNFRLDAIQAAVLRVKLRYLDAWIDARRDRAQRYARLFEDAGVLAALPACATQQCRVERCELESVCKVVIPAEAEGRKHTYNYYVIRTPDRDSIRERLTTNGIASEIYYPVPLHLQECFAELGYKSGDLPASECAARSTLALPMYPELTEEQQARVVEAFAG
jgi:dTDP-4-amino-4,6-dideoxygalactose transaminase